MCGIAGVRSSFSAVGFATGLKIFPRSLGPLYRRKYNRYRSRLCEEYGIGEYGHSGHKAFMRCRYRYKSHLFLPWLWELLIKEEGMRKVAKEVMECSDNDAVVVWSTDWCVKRPGSGGYFAWHQDSTYSGFSTNAVTCWLAFSAVSHDSGPVLMKEKSHLLGQLWHDEYESRMGMEDSSKYKEEENLLVLQQRIPEEGDVSYTSRLTEGQRKWVELKTVPALLEPGQASVHSFLTVHASQPNVSKRDRIGLAVRLVKCSPDGRTNGRGYRGTLLCGDEGVAQACGFKMESFVPQVAFGKRELQEFHHSMDVEEAIYARDERT